MSTAHKLLVLAAFAIGGLLLLAGAVIVLVRHDHIAAPAEEIVYDDFGFSVVGAQRAAQLGGQHAAGEFRSVELRVANHAQRVAFRMDNFHVRVVDAAGQTFEEVAALAQKPRQEIAAGESVVETHVFDLPAAAAEARLQISWGSVADKLDWLLLGERGLRLP